MPVKKLLKQKSAADLPSHQAKTYFDFKKKFIEEACDFCALSKTRTCLVPDRGNPGAKVLFIGEAPGAEEDKQGKSFVGRSGKLLDRILASIGLSADSNILVTSVLKCRPPDNRLPRPEEVEACRPHLLKQIELLRPALIVLLGATAFRHVFLREEKYEGITDMAGQITRKKLLRPGEKISWMGVEDTLPCMLLYHPAYLLYSPKMKAVMWEHVKLLRDYLIKENLLAPTPLAEPEKIPF